MSCKECANWKRGSATVYEGSGAVVSNVRDKGRCSVLGIETPEEFHCNHFEEGVLQQIENISKPGEPWQHWVMGPCPDCSGAGSGSGGACHRCAGTSKVRYYDDGWVGEEQTRKHPMEVRAEGDAKIAVLQQQIDSIRAGMPPPPQPPDLTKLAPMTRPDVTGTGAV